ncbi:hypothetical protein Pcinc_040239 [Petrolisthes cinctipes]|uniref:Uncharacterized protein n=1 Tax=Petrolisthes cinctipes TaxID=88211 RepID=A0AAE1BPJ5_PETCI|nr:hypothetical protein Pcinc_040239 [Petrolisthes cinctipes]
MWMEGGVTEKYILEPGMWKLECGWNVELQKSKYWNLLECGWKVELQKRKYWNLLECGWNVDGKWSYRKENTGTWNVEPGMWMEGGVTDKKILEPAGMWMESGVTEKYILEPGMWNLECGWKVELQISKYWNLLECGWNVDGKWSYR